MADVDAKGNAVEVAKGADFGQPLLEQNDKFEQHHVEAAKAFLSEDLPYYAQRIKSLIGRPEAAEFFAWMKEQAAKDGDECPLFHVLAPHCLEA